MIGARVDLRAGIAEAAAVHGDFGADPAAQPEARASGRAGCRCRHSRGSAGKRGDEEGARVLDPGPVNTPCSSVREHFGAIGPRPFLLPDEVALPLDIAGELDRARFVGVELLVRGRGLQVQHLVALQEIVAPELDGGELLAGADDAAKVSAPSGLKKLRSVQLASTRAPCPVP